MSPWEEVWCHFRRGPLGPQLPSLDVEGQKRGDWHTESPKTHKEPHTVGSQDGRA